jgi:hypothetical protein
MPRNVKKPHPQKRGWGSLRTFAHIPARIHASKKPERVRTSDSVETFPNLKSETREYTAAWCVIAAACEREFRILFLGEDPNCREGVYFRAVG